jgi:hypothetical protein
MTPWRPNGELVINVVAVGEVRASASTAAAAKL